MPGINKSPSSHPIDLDAFWEDFVVNLNEDRFYFPPHALLINEQNILINDHGGSLFDTLRYRAPRWYQVAAEAYIALYSWLGTTDARPLLQPVVATLIDQIVESYVVLDPTWSTETVHIPTGNGQCTTSFSDPVFMNLLKETIVAAQGVFYARTLEVVRHLLLPFNGEFQYHPGLIPSQTLVTPGQVNYVNSLVAWNPKTGYNLWHDFLTNEDGITVLCWFDRRSLRHLMDTVHFGVGSPGYLYIQELYMNLETGKEEWGPLTAATLHSTTWVLAAIYVYLWADVLGNQRFLTTRFTVNRRDAILEKQAKITIFLRQVLRRSVPGLTAEQGELAYQGLHRFMHTNPELPFST